MSQCEKKRKGEQCTRDNGHAGDHETMLVWGTRGKRNRRDVMLSLRTAGLHLHQQINGQWLLIGEATGRVKKVCADKVDGVPTRCVLIAPQTNGHSTDAAPAKVARPTKYD